jgi:peroxin-14
MYFVVILTKGITIVEDSLKEIKDQTNTALTTVSSQTKKVDDSLSSLETVLKELKEGDEKRDEEFKNVKGDIDALKELVPKVRLFFKKRDERARIIY